MSRTCCWSLLCLAAILGVANAQTIILREPGTINGGEASEDAAAFLDSSLMAEIRLVQTPASHVQIVEQVQRQRAALIQSLQQLQDQYCKAAMLDEALAVRGQLRRLQADAAVAFPALPGTRDTTGLTPYQLRGRNGEIHYLEVTGATSGTVWGSGPYTDDSDLATASVHSGHLNVGEKRVVAFRITPGKSSYAGSTANGVRTFDYGSFGGSVDILGAGIKAEDFHASRTSIDAEFVTVFLTGRATGSLWGDGIYTNDSDLATAAVHAGLLKVGESALVQVELLEGQPAYKSATRHGITSRPYGKWSGSIRLLKPPAR